MNVYEKIKMIEYNIDSNLNKIKRLAICSHSQDTFKVIEEMSKISTNIAKLTIEKQELLKTVNKLNEKDRLILEYKYDKYPNLPNVEVCKKLGISERTYYRRLKEPDIYKEKLC